MAKARRLNDWRKEHDAAVMALRSGAWWDGRTWRPAGTVPSTAKEAEDYRDAHARLTEILSEMVGSDDAEQLTKARRFARSGEADRSGEQPASENTRAEEIADATYELLRDQLPARRPPWTKLEAWLDDARTAELVTLPGKPGHVRVAGRTVSAEAIRTWRNKLRDQPVPTAHKLRMICERRKGRR